MPTLWTPEPSSGIRSRAPRPAGADASTGPDNVSNSSTKRSAFDRPGVPLCVPPDRQNRSFQSFSDSFRARRESVFHPCFAGFMKQFETNQNEADSNFQSPALPTELPSRQSGWTAGKWECGRFLARQNTDPSANQSPPGRHRGFMAFRPEIGAVDCQGEISDA